MALASDRAVRAGLTVDPPPGEAIYAVRAAYGMHARLTLDNLAPNANEKAR